MLPDEDEDGSVNIGLCEVLLNRFTVGNMTFTARQVNFFFELFFERYHPFCPILLQVRDPVQTYINEKFLFWAIIHVAAQNVMFDPAAEMMMSKQDLAELMQAVKDMAATLSVYSGRSLGTVQGLLLLSEWCFPSTRQKDDRGWHFANLAVQTGMYMGLHRPYHSFEYSSRRPGQALAESIQGREKTLAWISCHTLSILMANDIGVPAMIREDWVTVQAAAVMGKTKPDWLVDVPDTVLQALCIARHVDKAADLLGNSCTTPTGQLEGPAAQIVWAALDREWADFELSVGSLPPHLDFCMHMTRVRLSCYGLQIGTSGAYRSNIASQLYASSIRALEIVGNQDQGKMFYWPRSASSGIKPAALVLLHLIASEDGRDLEIGPALAAVTKAYRALITLSVHGNDKHSRSSKLVAFTSKDAQARRREGRLYGSKHPDNFAEIRSRMGLANYYHDCLATAKRARGRHGPEYQNDPDGPSIYNPPPGTAANDLIGQPTEMLLDESPPFWLHGDDGMDGNNFDDFISQWAQMGPSSMGLFPMLQ
ncbi:hypothetical protein M231_05390 [Tremella mesenterica]|uniref:Xylanolytic transcriptional activator regulatory domain-containing protein n=2 Tax=Tremella mesenterica TaxID=5217 RepID=A0A4Q1BI72_TREME|nr:hypothetical protein M231_05390 [Tremella mesenterica]